MSTLKHWQNDNNPTELLAYLRSAPDEGTMTRRANQLFAFACVEQLAGPVYPQLSSILDICVKNMEKGLDDSESAMAYNIIRITAPPPTDVYLLIVAVIIQAALRPDASKILLNNELASVCSHASAVIDRRDEASSQSIFDQDGGNNSTESNKKIISHLLREIFGPDPHNPPHIDPAWMTDTVVPMIRHMRDTGDFSAMPILADAMQDAGCEDPRILDYLRDNTKPHACGNWFIEAASQMLPPELAVEGKAQGTAKKKGVAE